MIQIGNRSYLRLADILGFAGTAGLSGIQQEVVPTQDLTRILLDSRVKRCVYNFFQETIVGTAAATAQWGDLSDWQEVQINGITAATDADLPDEEEDRILIYAACQVSTQPAHYTNAVITRSFNNTAATAGDVATFGTFVTGHLCAPLNAPSRLPQSLMFGETDIIFRTVGGGVDGDIDFTLIMLAAERGVMSLFPGV